MKKERIIEIQPVKIESATICIEGDGDLVLNKMNARTIRESVSYTHLSCPPGPS